MATWGYWTSSSASTTCATTSGAYAWGAWCGSGTTTATSDDVWSTWATVSYTTSTATTANVWYTWSEIPVAPSIKESDAELERMRKAAEERAAESRKRAEEARERAREAEVKACDLLKDLIGEEQFAVYQETGRLLVKGREFDYLLHKGGNVTRVEKDKMVDLCIHLRDRSTMPPTDNVIALMLQAKADGYGLDRIANVMKSRPVGELPRAAAV